MSSRLDSPDGCKSRHWMALWLPGAWRKLEPFNFRQLYTVLGCERDCWGCSAHQTISASKEQPGGSHLKLPRWPREPLKGINNIWRRLAKRFLLILGFPAASYMCSNGSPALVVSVKEGALDGLARLEVLDLQGCWLACCQFCIRNLTVELSLFRAFSHIKASEFHHVMFFSPWQGLRGVELHEVHLFLLEAADGVVGLPYALPCGDPSGTQTKTKDLILIGLAVSEVPWWMVFQFQVHGNKLIDHVINGMKHDILGTLLLYRQIHATNQHTTIRSYNIL